MVIGDIRVIQADIPVKRPHTMSFTTLHAVNFVFVRLETIGGLVGWGEAACLGGPTWSEESAESVAITIERYIAPWLTGRDATQIEPLRHEMARRLQGNPFARAAVEMALWDLNGRALGVPIHRLLGGRMRDRVPLSWSLAVAKLEDEVAEAAELSARGQRIFKIKTAAHPLAHDLERVKRIREVVGPAVSLRVDAPIRAGTGQARHVPSGPSSPTVSTSWSNRFHAGILKVWLSWGEARPSPSWPTSRAFHRRMP